MDASSSRWTISTVGQQTGIYFVLDQQRSRYENQTGTEYMDRKREGKGRLSAARRRTDIEREG